MEIVRHQYTRAIPGFYPHEIFDEGDILIFSKENSDKTENSKTSIIFSVKHEAGTLYQVINEFYQHKINLTKIESRPNKNTAWEYNFYVDFEGHQDDSSIKDMLEKLRNHSTFLKILGSYPIAKLD